MKFLSKFLLITTLLSIIITNKLMLAMQVPALKRERSESPVQVQPIEINDLLASCLEKYFLPAELRREIDFEERFLYKGNDIKRLINAERMRECIKRHNLSCLKVPRKYLYKADSGILFVFAEKIVCNFKLSCLRGCSILTLEETKQIITLHDETGYSDFNGNNVMRDVKDGKLAFIDTEERSFNVCNKATFIIKMSKNFLFDSEETKLWFEEYGRRQGGIFSSNDKLDYASGTLDKSYRFDTDPLLTRAAFLMKAEEEKNRYLYDIQNDEIRSRQRLKERLERDNAVRKFSKKNI